MLIPLDELEIINKATTKKTTKLEKPKIPKPEGKITRKEAKKVYPDLPPGGHWVTIRGHHIYIVDHKIVAGAMPWMNKKGEVKAKKIPKKHLKLLQAHYDYKRAKEQEKAEKEKAEKEATTKKTNSKTKSAELKKKTKTTKKKASETKEPKKTDKKKVEYMAVYHGTKMPSAEKILKEGFKIKFRSLGDDLGNCAYFKSPEYDALDEELRKKASPNAQKYERDTVGVVNHFAKLGRKRAVVHCRIPKNEVLDLTKGKPKELEDLMKQQHDIVFNYDLSREEQQKQLLKHTYAYLTDKDMNEVGEVTEKDVRKAIDSLDISDAMKEHLRKSFDFVVKRSKRTGEVLHLAPYELYCVKHGYKAIVDVLEYFPVEGWQIGVYDPSIIEVVDVGKKLKRNDKGEVELEKALTSKSKANVDQLPYTLLGVQKQGNHYHLFVGAIDDRVEKSAFLYILV